MAKKKTPIVHKPHGRRSLDPADRAMLYWYLARPIGRGVLTFSAWILLCAFVWGLVWFLWTRIAAIIAAILVLQEPPGYGMFHMLLLVALVIAWATVEERKAAIIKWLGWPSSLRKSTEPAPTESLMLPISKAVSYGLLSVFVTSFVWKAIGSLAWWPPLIVPLRLWEGLFFTYDYVLAFPLILLLAVFVLTNLERWPVFRRSRFAIVITGVAGFWLLISFVRWYLFVFEPRIVLPRIFG